MPGVGKQRRDPAGRLQVLETAPWRGMLLSAMGCMLLHTASGHSHLLDPQRTVHIAPKTELGKVQVILFKTSSLSILYAKRSVYLEVTLKEPQLRIKKKKKQPNLSKGIFA